MSQRRGTTRLLLSALPLLLAGCELFDKGGHLDLRLAAAPADEVSAVVLSIDGVDIRNADGDNERFTFEVPRRIDLLGFDAGDAALLLDDEFLPEADYESIRLRVRSDADNNDSYLVLGNGQTVPLYVPEDASDGLRVFKDFTVDDGDRRKMTIDLDLRRSLRKPEGSEFAYRLVPSLRIVDDDRSGTIAGRIADSRISSDCRPAVYVFAGRDAAADDIDGDGGDPFTSARVLREAGEYVYTAAFLPAGDYTVALTCDADDDDPQDDDALRFITAQAKVAAEKTVRQDF